MIRLLLLFALAGCAEQGSGADRSTRDDEPERSDSKARATDADCESACQHAGKIAGGAVPGDWLDHCRIACRGHRWSGALVSCVQEASDAGSLDECERIRRKRVRRLARKEDEAPGATARANLADAIAAGTLTLAQVRGIASLDGLAVVTISPNEVRVDDALVSSGRLGTVLKRRVRSSKDQFLDLPDEVRRKYVRGQGVMTLAIDAHTSLKALSEVLETLRDSEIYEARAAVGDGTRALVMFAPRRGSGGPAPPAPRSVVVSLSQDGLRLQPPGRAPTQLPDRAALYAALYRLGERSGGSLDNVRLVAPGATTWQTLAELIDAISCKREQQAYDSPEALSSAPPSSDSNGGCQALALRVTVELSVGGAR